MVKRFRDQGQEVRVTLATRQQVRIKEVFRKEEYQEEIKYAQTREDYDYL